tara:strand:- start:917 stop:1318 length:402 start_codon:yes stop_codon:yes gene_type:complete
MDLLGKLLRSTLLCMFLVTCLRVVAAQPSGALIIFCTDTEVSSTLAQVLPYFHDISAAVHITNHIGRHFAAKHYDAPPQASTIKRSLQHMPSESLLSLPAESPQMIEIVIATLTEFLKEVSTDRNSDADQKTV